MGVFTSSQLVGKNENAGVAMGNKPAAQTKLDPGFVYKFKVDVPGKSHISVPIDETVEKLELVDGIYEIKKTMKKEKAEALRKFFDESADFERVISVESRPKAKVDPKEHIYFAGHPDSTDDRKVTGGVSVEIDGKEIELECVEGCVTTEDVAVYQALLAKGYTEYKPRVEKK